jgi:hypothetical protein
MLKLLVLAFLEVKLKKNTKTISSGILIHKNFKKNVRTISSGVFICKNASVLCNSKLLVIILANSM